MALSEAEKSVYIETAKLLSGGERRMFMARVVKILGTGGQRLAEKELGWNRGTIRKGLSELEKGRPTPAKGDQRGRKPAEKHLPHLLRDIKDVMLRLNETDPVFQRTQYYTSVSAASVRQHLILWKGYTDAELPTKETIRVKLRLLNYRLRRF